MVRRALWMYLLAFWLLCRLPANAEEGVPITFRLRLDQPAQQVYLAGTFNDWQVGRTPMHSEDGKNWQVTLHLMPGVYQYKFVVNGTEWRTDPQAIQQIDDGMGNLNSVLVVEANTINPPARRGDGVVSRSALRHRPEEMFYLHADEGDVFLTVRTRRADVQTVSLLLNNGKQRTSREIPRVARDALFEYYRVAFPARSLHYLIQVRDARTVLWLSPEGVSDTQPKQWFSLNPNQLPRVHTPHWVADAVFYQIMPDRFFNANPHNDPDPSRPLDETGRTDQFFGGDLWGIVQKVDYLHSLGITALYLTPVFTSATHHKYDTDDYTRVDPHLGGDDALLELRHHLRQRQMRLVLDGVFNHVGVHFFAFRDLLSQQQDSRYLNWFTVHRFPVRIENPPPYSAWWGIPFMPKLNLENEQVRRYLLDNVVEYWMRRAALDGWRLDVANEVPDHFWREFRAHVKRINPEAVIIGEIWGNASHWLRGDMFDSVMNYPWRGILLDWVAFGHTPPSVMDSRLQMLALSYPRSVTYAMYNMLSSHDTPRLRTLCGGDWRKVRLAFLLQMTLPGAPAIYYGDEVGMEGGSIPDNRRPMEWNPCEEGIALRQYVTALIQLRHRSPALRRGDWHTLLADDRRNLYVFARRHRQEQVVVAINRNETPALVRLRLPGRWRVAISSQADKPNTPFSADRNGWLQMNLPPMTGWVLTHEGDASGRPSAGGRY